MTPELRRIAFWMAVGFLIVAVSMTATVGWRFAGPLLAIGLALVTVGAAILPSFAHHAWNDGHRATAGVLAATAAVFMVAEYGSHVSYAVTHRSAEVETVSHATTAYGDGRATIASLEAKEKALDAQALWESRPVASIVADIEKAKLSPRWASTSECTDVTAKRSRDFCASYASLVAEKANAEEALTIRAELDTVRKELASARQTSEGKAPGVSMASTTDTLVAQLASLSLAPSDDARKAAGIGIGSWLALAFALGAGVFWFIAHMPAAHGAGGHAIAHPVEHPDLEAAQKAAAVSLNAMAAKMREKPAVPAYEAHRLTGAIATAGGIMPVLGGIRMHEVKAA